MRRVGGIVIVAAGCRRGASAGDELVNVIEVALFDNRGHRVGTRLRIAHLMVGAVVLLIRVVVDLTTLVAAGRLLLLLLLMLLLLIHRSI